MTKNKNKKEEVLLHLENVSKIYKMGQVDVPALKNVTVEIKKGDFVAIIGASGSGKSTLLHVVGAMEHPDSGEISFGRQSLGELDIVGRAEFRNREIGFGPRPLRR